ncbi:MAG: hypothetical protein WAK26_12570 [Terracidiphilus sp.]
MKGVPLGPLEDIDEIGSIEQCETSAGNYIPRYSRDERWLRKLEKSKPDRGVVVGVADIVETTHVQTLAEEDSTLKPNTGLTREMRGTCAIQTTDP